LCRSIKVLFTQSTIAQGCGPAYSFAPCPLPHPTKRGSLVCRLGPTDNKKQFATHWALTTTNDNSIFLTPVSLSLSLSLHHSLPVSLCLPVCPSLHDLFILLCCVLGAVLSQMTTYGQMVGVVFGLRWHSNKIILFTERFQRQRNEYRIICDIRSSQWPGQQTGLRLGIGTEIEIVLLSP